MLNALKKHLPKPLKNLLRNIKNRTIDAFYKKRLAKKMQVRHKELLEELKGKDKIKVVFLAIHKSVWKVDPVFKKMQTDPLFEPIILICPYTVFGEKRMWQDMEESYNYFSEKGYPTISSYDKNLDRWITLEEIDTDIVFFTNPHELTRQEYYKDAYLNYLSCYAGYGMPISYYSATQYNTTFSASLWKIFAQSKEVKNNYIKHAPYKNKNIFIFGDSFIESIQNLDTNTDHKPWKNQHLKKRVIYAPHHSILDNEILPLSCFLKYAQQFLELAKNTKGTIHWSFKPHPLLKSKLYTHPEWGIEKTDTYYSFWDKNNFTQLDEGEYIDLFRESDALILDSSSFLGEYLFTQKPSLYLTKAKTHDYMTQLGIECLNANYEASDFEKVNHFIQSIVIEGNDLLQDKRRALVSSYNKTLNYQPTSNLIINELKRNLLK